MGRGWYIHIRFNKTARVERYISAVKQFILFKVSLRISKVKLVYEKNSVLTSKIKEKIRQTKKMHCRKIVLTRSSRMYNEQIFCELTKYFRSPTYLAVKDLVTEQRMPDSNTNLGMTVCNLWDSTLNGRIGLFSPRWQNMTIASTLNETTKKLKCFSFFPSKLNSNLRLFRITFNTKNIII